MYKYYLLFILISWVLFLIPGCKKDLSPANGTPKPEITLSTIEESGLHEIYLRTEIKNIILPVEIKLQRNDSLLSNFAMASNDTTVIDTGLTLSTDYNYRAFLFKDNILQDSSDVLTTRTMDTSSHDFTWQTFTFGDGNGSTIKDVFIINENDIWAVGNIQVLDSTGTRYIPYNAVHWDGQSWQLQKIYAITSFGDTSRGPINCVFGFDSDDIWTFSQAGSYSHWNGKTWKSEFIFERIGGISKIWGISSNDLYFVGTNGNITHYDGSSWQLMTSGTDTDLLDVWGSPDGSTVWACGWSSGFFESVLLRYDSTQWQVFWDMNNGPIHLPYFGILSSIWFKHFRDKMIVAGGEGVFRQSQTHLNNVTYELDRTKMPEFPWRTRGSDINNVFIVGDNSMIMHYNGLTYSLFNEIYIPGSFDRLLSVDAKGDMVVVVGRQGSTNKALLYLGRRTI